jgi:hypothetical protein
MWRMMAAALDPATQLFDSTNSGIPEPVHLVDLRDPGYRKVSMP